ncbi:single-strand DNA-binding protein [Kribbella orskensis]|uniref:Single-stranded DNA-binding protein n=1 Tax=Kribbella orskensis TaxID=2512216 RepID=A0ABY2BP36_9ACTN|nr:MULTISPECIES: single-stranded DNA-binding protein [Kribbella]TCN39835.1 single-strand DNA-binding protein [Kribbella sp. VKM Ac-2500]TCO27382.1 single-strand DNA-binding protein [Kribbella orskensis]
MSNETIITIVGNLTDDPELRFTPSGAALARFSIASTPRRFDKAAGEYVDGDTLFLRATAWRQVAENVAESLQRGQRVIATGRLRQSNWETPEGDKRSSIDLEVDEIGPSLTFATAKVTKATRAAKTSGNPDDPWASANREPVTAGTAANSTAGGGDPWTRQGMEEPPF